MPILLEIGLNCRKFGLSPKDFGLDGNDPRVFRSINVALNIFDAVLDRRQIKKETKNLPSDYKGKKPDWDRDNPEMSKLLKWAAGESHKDSKSDNPDLVEIEISRKK